MEYSYRAIPIRNALTEPYTYRETPRSFDLNIHLNGVTYH